MPRMQANSVTYGNYFFIDWDLVGQSTAGNYSSINWRAYWHFQGSDHQLDNGYADLAGGRRWSNGGRIYNYAGNFSTRDMLLASGSFNVGHNNDGTQSMWVAGGATGYQVGRSEAGATYGLPTIPRYASITGLSGSISDEATSVYINYSNPYGGAVRARLYIRPLGSTGGFTQVADVPNYSSGANFAASVDWSSIRSVLANAAQGQLLYRVTNGVGDTDHGWENQNKLTIVNANPTFAESNISYEDTDAAVVAVTGDDQKIVQSRSDLVAAFTAATGLKGATITSYKVTLGTDVRNFTTAQSAISYGELNISADTPLIIEATDSRGYKTAASKTITVLPWTVPRGVVSIKRVNNYEDATKVKVDATIDSLDGMNSIQVLKLRKKKVSDSTWTENALTNGVEATVNMDKLYEWNLEIVITDKFGSTTYTALLPKGIPIMFIDPAKLSIGIGKFPSGNEALEVADNYLIPIMKKVHPVGRIVMSTSSTNPGTLPELAGTTWAAWGVGRVPVGVDVSQTEFDTVEETGGHKLMQSHTHSMRYAVQGSGGGLNGIYGMPYNASANGSVVTQSGEPATSGELRTGVLNNGGGNAQNLQPYITVYMWKRTA